MGSEMYYKRSLVPFPRYSDLSKSVNFYIPTVNSAPVRISELDIILRKFECTHLTLQSTAGSSYHA